MARALSHDARLIVMDEPSAVLAHDEVDNLFRVIRDLTAQGVAVVYISHRLEEIRAIGDRVTVLKDGRTVATEPSRQDDAHPRRRIADDRPDDRVRLPAAARAPAPTEPVCSTSRDSRWAGVFSDVSFQVRAGEIVGIAGLVGAGRSEVLETVYGARRRQRLAP